MNSEVGTPPLARERRQTPSVQLTPDVRILFSQTMRSDLPNRRRPARVAPASTGSPLRWKLVAAMLAVVVLSGAAYQVSSNHPRLQLTANWPDYARYNWMGYHRTGKLPGAVPRLV